MNNFSLKKSALALAVASSFSLMSLPANAAGLGRLTVFSGLGQPLRAEIEISATVDELAGMSARLAPDEVFKKSGVEYSYILPDLRFKIVTKNKKTILEVTTNRTINEPFLDFLVELNWPSGRLVREYTFLLDPPEIKKHIAKGVKKPTTSTYANNKSDWSSTGASGKSTASSGGAGAKKSSGGGGFSQAGISSGEYVVQKGDTLGGIAKRAQTISVTTEQMMIALYQANPDAFLQNNINLLKSGVRLRIPSVEEAANISERDARRIYSQHVSQWNEYRQHVAELAPSTQSASSTQTASGKITAAGPQEQLPSSGVSRDQVRVSTTESGSKEAAEINQLAQASALKEAETRLQMLERNMAEMQKLLELKNQQIAELQQRAQGGTPDLTKPAEPMPSPIEEPLPEPDLEDPTIPEQAPEAAPEPQPAPAPEPEPQPEPKPAPLPEPEEPMEEPSFLEENMLYIGGGVLALLLLGGFAYYKKRKNDAEDDEEDEDAYRSSIATAMSGVDSQADEPLSAMSTSDGEEVNNDVDPLSEAEVYIAYGRDNKAEEVLTAAMAADPARLDLPLRLLDIYAKNKEVAKFEEVAQMVQELTQAEGPDWAQVVEKGLEIDPTNPLYASGDPAVGSIAPVDDEAFMMASVPPSLPPEDLAAASAIVETPTMVFSPAQDDSLVMNSNTIDFAPASQAPQQPAGNMVDFEMSNPAGSAADAAVADDPQIREEIVTKLDLAKAYEEMGDIDGAKELYQEITSAAAPADLKAQAQEAFDRLSAT